MTNDLEKYGIKNIERTPCEIWTRVMGYHRPISSFNIGKQGEVAERKYFDQKKCESKILSS
jgi:anaerobic ribonucleoside-triphosphate reductase